MPNAVASHQSFAVKKCHSPKQSWKSKALPFLKTRLPHFPRNKLATSFHVPRLQAPLGSLQAHLYTIMIMPSVMKIKAESSGGGSRELQSSPRMRAKELQSHVSEQRPRQTWETGDCSRQLQKIGKVGKELASLSSLSSPLPLPGLGLRLSASVCMWTSCYTFQLLCSRPSVQNHFATVGQLGPQASCK